MDKNEVSILTPLARAREVIHDGGIPPGVDRAINTPTYKNYFLSSKAKLANIN